MNNKNTNIEPEAKYIKISDLPNNFVLQNAQISKNGKCSECRAYLIPGIFDTPFGKLLASHPCSCQQWYYDTLSNQLEDSDHHSQVFYSDSEEANNSLGHIES